MEKVKNLLNSIENPVLLINRDLQVKYANHEFLERYKLQLSADSCTPVKNIVVKNILSLLESAIEKCFQGEELKLEFPDGFILPGESCTVKLIPDFGEAKHVGGVCLILTNLCRSRESSSKGFSEQEACLKLINSLPDAVFVLQDGVVKYVNPTLCEVSEYSEEELLGSEYTRFIAPEKKANVVILYQ